MIVRVKLINRKSLRIHRLESFLTANKNERWFFPHRVVRASIKFSNNLFDRIWIKSKSIIIRLLTKIYIVAISNRKTRFPFHDQMARGKQRGKRDSPRNRQSSNDYYSKTGICRGNLDRIRGGFRCVGVSKQLWAGLERWLRGEPARNPRIS